MPGSAAHGGVTAGPRGAALGVERPAWYAVMTSWTRSLAPSLASRWATCVLAVPAVMNKVARDLGVGHAQAHQPEHLAFAVGDPGQFPGLAIGTVLAGELPDQAAGHARRDHGVAGRDHADGGQDVLQG